jgi:hypothetical protein
MPRRENVLSRIDIAVVALTTRPADPFSYSKSCPTLRTTAAYISRIKNTEQADTEKINILCIHLLIIISPKINTLGIYTIKYLQYSLAISRTLVAKRNRLAGSLTLMGLSRRNAGTKE